MTQVWIVHRRERERAALMRLAAEAGAVAGAPSDAHFAEAPPAEVVVLGLCDDWEAELEFAHRQRGRLGAARWILVGEAGRDEAAHALFDKLSLDYVSYPPPGRALRRLLSGARAPARPSLSQRDRRDAVAGRFSRWLSELPLPGLLRALDPRLAEVPLLVRGEPGSGRGTLIRYAHHFGGTAAGRLVHLACDADSGVDAIRAALDRRGLFQSAVPAVCVWLDELGRLAPRHQRELGEWLEPGGAAVRTPLLRWAASVDARDPELEPALADRLGTLELELPPLRERTGHLESIVAETAAWWARARRETRRRFAADALAVLGEHPWPGNLQELETVVVRSLAASGGEVLGAEDLRMQDGAEGLAGAALPAEPVDAESVGELLDETPEAPGAARPAELPPPDRADSGPVGDGELRQLASALSRQVHNPLATLRTFAELLPDRFDDPVFRERFAEMLREDVGRLHGLLGRVDQLAALDAPRRAKVDVAALLEHLLEQRREAFRRRHLLVLKELDPSQPLTLADPDHLRVAFEALLDKAVELVPERGDLYLASHRHGGGEGDGDPTTRVLLRFHDPRARDQRDAGAADHSLELLIAELLVRAQGGSLTLGTSDAEERVLVVDLPSPP